MSQRDYYEVLGVSRDAQADEIKKAYKSLAIKFHPDRNPGDDAAIESFKEASEAYEVLSNDEKRARYNRFGHDGVKGAARSGGAGFSDIGDIFDVFGDLFEGFGFGGSGRRGRSGPRPTRGDTLGTRVTVDLLEAAKGCSKTIEFSRSELCGSCQGSGAKPGTTPERCEYCNGQGQVVQNQGFFRTQTTCPACRGEGTRIHEKCGNCRGTGRQAETVKRDIPIPAGVDTGTVMRVPGEGESGMNGGPRGDLHVEIEVADNSLFERDEHNLICDVPLSYTQAVLGADIEVPCLEGTTIHHFYPGTQPGEIIRIRGGGMPVLQSNRTGDLLLRVIVEVPKKINGEQETLLRDLAEIERTNVSAHRKSFFERVKEWFVPHDELQ
jgi:molecular chaperone DnaJ